MRGLALSMLVALAVVGCGRSSDGTSAETVATSPTAVPVESVQCIPQPEPAPLPWPPGVTVPEGTNPPLDGADWPPAFDLETALRDHFGARFSMIWRTSARDPDLGAQRLVIGVVAPTAEDHEYVATLPVPDNRVDIAPTKYSDTQLQEYANTLTAIEVAPSLWGVALGLRDDGLSATGQPAVLGSVTECDPELPERIASLLPPDAVQARVHAEPSLASGT